MWDYLLLPDTSSAGLFQVSKSLVWLCWLTAPKCTVLFVQHLLHCQRSSLNVTLCCWTFVLMRPPSYFCRRFRDVKRTYLIPSHGSFLNLCRLKTIKLPLNEDGIISMHSVVWRYVSSKDRNFQWTTFLFYCALGILNLRLLVCVRW